MGHAMLAAIGIETLAAGDAARRLQAAGRIIEAAVDDLAVARGGLGADPVGAFEDDDLVPLQREGPRRRQADHPGPDDDRFDLFHRLSQWRDDTRFRRYHIAAMTTFLTLLLVLAMLGVLGVLGMGVATMIRGGNPRLSNRFMQARVVMQGVALLVLALLMLLASHR